MFLSLLASLCQTGSEVPASIASSLLHPERAVCTSHLPWSWRVFTFTTSGWGPSAQLISFWPKRVSAYTGAPSPASSLSYGEAILAVYLNSSTHQQKSHKSLWALHPRCKFLLYSSWLFTTETPSKQICSENTDLRQQFIYIAFHIHLYFVYIHVHVC